MGLDLEEHAPNLLVNLDKFIEYSKLEKKIISVVQDKTHQRTGMPYLYFTMQLRNAEPEIMLYNAGNLKKFVDDYEDGRIKVQFTLEELLNEAREV